MRNLNIFSSEMIITYFLLLFFTDSLCLSIGSTSDKHVTKRDATGDLFPDWVPFKNKHGEELGEFVNVVKRKPKKRLAPPANFILKSQGDQEVDEYIGQDETSDDYFDKKEWSNTGASENIDANKSDPAKLAGIDKIVNIITKKEANPFQDEGKINTKIDEVDNVVNDNETEEIQVEKDVSQNEPKPVSKESNKDEGDYDYEEKESEKVSKGTETDEQRENEAKKAKILDSVDELKERHAEEQRQISEKVKEEEMTKEELERDNLRHARHEYDKYNNEEPVWKKISSDYDEYDERGLDARDKYKIVTKKSVKTTEAPSKNIKLGTNAANHVPQERISLFTNPQAYLVNDYEDSEEKSTTIKPQRNKMSRDKSLKKFSSQYVQSKPKDENRVRISLVPDDEDLKEGEPTLFFPKKRPSKGQSTTLKSTEAVTDSAESETVQNKNRRIPLAFTNNKAYESAPSAPTAGDSVPAADDTALKASVAADKVSAVTDPLPSATDKKEEKQPENYEIEKGGGKEHHASHEEEHGEHGKKSYEGEHEETKTAKGHHDKEDHVGKYDDHGGVDEHHHDESGHYGHHHHEEHGKKHAKYEESGKHSKGHSTKGSHDIHKKEEYEKNVEFFEEEGDSDEEEKHGGHHDEKGHSKGGHYKNGNKETGHEGHLKGDNGHFSKVGFGYFDKGHKTAEGQDQHGRHAREKFLHDGKEGGKKWIYHHGSPPRTANLVVIDRRTDPYTGPRFYG